MDHKKSLFAIIAIISIIMILVTVFYIKISLSESMSISKGSLASYLLIPQLLKSTELQQLGTIKDYYYDASDGVKPKITAVNMSFDDINLIKESNLKEYFLSVGFRENDKNELWKNNRELTIDIEQKNYSWLVTVAILEYDWAKP